MAKARNQRPEPEAADDDFAPLGDIGGGEPHEEIERGGAPLTVPAPGAPSEERVAKLESELAELKKLLTSAAAAGTVAPPGYKLVKDEPDQDAKSRVEQEAIKAHIEKGKQRITQEEADRRYLEGKHRFVCGLDDGNGHPELVISATHEVDAAARYMDVCGIQSSEKKVRVAKA